MRRVAEAAHEAAACAGGTAHGPSPVSYSLILARGKIKRRPPFRPIFGRPRGTSRAWQVDGLRWAGQQRWLAMLLVVGLGRAFLTFSASGARESSEFEVIIHQFRIHSFTPHPDGGAYDRHLRMATKTAPEPWRMKSVTGKRVCIMQQVNESTRSVGKRIG